MHRFSLLLRCGSSETYISSVSSLTVVFINPPIHGFPNETDTISLTKYYCILALFNSTLATTLIYIERKIYLLGMSIHWQVMLLKSWEAVEEAMGL